MPKQASPDLEEAQQHRYPEDVTGVQLIMGMPADRPREPIALDVVKTLLVTLVHAKENLPGKPLDIIIADDIVWKLAEGRNVVEVLREIDKDPENPLRICAEVRKAIIEALVFDIVGEDRKDVRVLTLSEYLRDQKDKFITPFQYALHKKESTSFRLNITDLEKSGITFDRKPKFDDAIEPLIPPNMSSGKSPEELEKLKNYVLAELVCIMMSHDQKKALLFYPRESDYIDVLAAYMEAAFGMENAGEELRKYIYLDRDLDGEQLPLIVGKIKNQTVNLKSCPSYRVNKEGQRVLAYPPDRYVSPGPDEQKRAAEEGIEPKLNEKLDKLPPEVREQLDDRLAIRLLSMMWVFDHPIGPIRRQYEEIFDEDNLPKDRSAFSEFLSTVSEQKLWEAVDTLATKRFADAIDKKLKAKGLEAHAPKNNGTVQEVEIDTYKTLEDPDLAALVPSTREEALAVVREKEGATRLLVEGELATVVGRNGKRNGDNGGK